MGGIPISKEDVTESFIRSSGPGGQNVNKVATCVMLIHRPTGIIIKCHEFRSQYHNRIKAWELLHKAIEERELLKIKQRKHSQEKIRRQNKKRSLVSKERMLSDKKKHALKKRDRKHSSKED